MPPPLAAPRDPQPGDVVDGRWTLVREIAVGGMGVVFEARSDDLPQGAALKLLHAGWQYRQDVRERLLREARALELARHPAVVRVLGSGTCATHGAFLVTEMLRGRPLDGLLAARERLGVADTMAIGVQLAEALAHVHRRGVVHRDVKPGNVFVTRRDGTEAVCLIDFGIARILADDVATAGGKLTQEGDVLGTLDYMAPEQLLGSDVRDPRCDVYAVGATLYECLTGIAPREGEYEDRLRELVEGRVPPLDLRAARADVPAPVAAAIERALCTRPDDRHADADTLAAELRAALAPGPTALLGLSSRPPAPSARERAAAESAMPLLLARKPAESAPILLQRRAPSEGDDEPIPLARRADEPILLAATRRKHARAPYVTPLTLTGDGGLALAGRTEDISEGGVFALLAGAPPASAEVRARFALPITGEIVEQRATISWVRPGKGRRRAVGLHFVDLPPDTAATIRTYVGLAAALA